MGNIQEIENQTSVQVSVVLPALQSGFAGVLAGLSSASAADIWGWSAITPAFLLGWSLGSLAVFCWSWQRWRNSLDFLLGVNKARITEVPSRVMASTTRVLRIENAQVHGPYVNVHWKDIEFDRLGVTYEQMVEMADAVINRGAEFGVTHLSGTGNLSRSQFTTIRDQLFVPKNWASWNNPRAHAQGIKLTREGILVLRSIAPTLPMV